MGKIVAQCCCQQGRLAVGVKAWLHSEHVSVLFVLTAQHAHILSLSLVSLASCPRSALAKLAIPLPAQNQHRQCEISDSLARCRWVLPWVLGSSAFKVACIAAQLQPS